MERTTDSGSVVAVSARGAVHKYGADVDTDVIIPARYLTSSDPAELAAHCMEDIDTGFIRRVKPGDVMVATDNFGCGSSREHAPIAIKAAGISCVIAASFARIFYRNAVNIGLPIMECPQAAAQIPSGAEIEVDFLSGMIREPATGRSWQARPFPPFIREIIDAGGLVAATRKRLEAAAASAKSGTDSAAKTGVTAPAQADSQSAAEPMATAAKSAAAAEPSANPEAGLSAVAATDAQGGAA